MRPTMIYLRPPMWPVQGMQPPTATTTTSIKGPSHFSNSKWSQALCEAGLIDSRSRGGQSTTEPLGWSFPNRVLTLFVISKTQFQSIFCLQSIFRKKTSCITHIYGFSPLILRLYSSRYL